jgi:hypothetical protein
MPFRLCNPAMIYPVSEPDPIPQIRPGLLHILLHNARHVSHRDVSQLS